MPGTEGFPGRITIVPDDYHAEYAGTAEDGRRFFITTPFLPGANEFIATFFWKADGSYDSMNVEEFGPRESLDHAAREAALARHLSDLGAYVLEGISVAPFSEDAFGTSFGFIPQAYEGMVSVNLMPGDSMAFFEPWDSGEYDT
jgi:hypothetical protein